MSSVTKNAALNQAMPQDVIQVEDAVARVARVIFAYRWPNALWADPLWQSEREDCTLLAYQFKEVFSARWTIFDAVERLTEQLVHLGYGNRELTMEEHHTVKEYAESCIEDFVPLFTGDASENWKHVPEDEVDDSEIEVLDRKGRAS